MCPPSGINLLCAAKEYDQIYWVMYSGQSFKFKGLCVVVHPIKWVMYNNPALNPFKTDFSLTFKEKTEYIFLSYVSIEELFRI